MKGRGYKLTELSHMWSDTKEERARAKQRHREREDAALSAFGEAKEALATGLVYSNQDEPSGSYRKT